jgi:hypothetical protein
VDALRVVAQHLQRLAADAADAVADVAQPFLQRRRVVPEGGEHHAGDGRHAQLAQPVRLHVEVLGQAAFAAQAVAEGDEGQVALRL